MQKKSKWHPSNDDDNKCDESVASLGQNQLASSFLVLMWPDRARGIWHETSNRDNSRLPFGGYQCGLFGIDISSIPARRCGERSLRGIREGILQPIADILQHEASTDACSILDVHLGDMSNAIQFCVIKPMPAGLLSAMTLSSNLFAWALNATR